MAVANQAVEASLTPRLLHAVTLYPVPADPIAASMKAQKASHQASDEKDLGAILQRLDNELALNNDGSSTHNDDPFVLHMVIQDPRSEKRKKGSQLPVRTSRGSANGIRPSYPRNSGFGERSGVIWRYLQQGGLISMRKQVATITASSAQLSSIIKLESPE